LCGGTVLLAQIGRRAGKKKQPELFERWGGKPTTRGLRHRGDLSEAKKDRLHRLLSELFPEEEVPSKEEEKADQEKADEQYDLLVSLLRSHTRDKNRFPLVFQENCNYGFRRNLWGLKPYGVVLSILSTASIGGVILAKVFGQISGGPTSLEIVGILICLILSITWTILVDPDWVQTAAEEYRNRLFEAAERTQKNAHESS
jgi:hypothetical protein